MGSMWGVEGQFIYALTRALQPAHVAEFGTHVGCSATHFLAAMAVKRHGSLDSVDPWEGAGYLVPDDLREHWRMHYALGTEWLSAQPDASFNILFEDMVHGWEATGDWWRVALRKVRPGGVILSHDATHAGVGADVQQGIANAGVVPTLYSIDPADCGFAVYQAPGEHQSEQLLSAETLAKLRAHPFFADDPPEPAKKPAPRKRAPAKKAAVKK
jgi:hypothetical protein